MIAAGLIVASALPLFNFAATGDPTTDLYRLVWDYDRLGFGDGHGRTGHSIANGLRHAHYDLSLAGADLYGWQPHGITPDLVEHLQRGRTAWPVRAYSFVLLPFGLVIGLAAGAVQRHDLVLRFRLLGLWCAGAILWVLILARPTWFFLSNSLFLRPGYSWLWVVVALAWVNLPLIAFRRWQNQPQIPWTWLLFAAASSILILNMTYWTGSMRYSTRYYFEALTAVALLSAVPAILATSRWAKITSTAAVTALSAICLVHYSIPRISALHRFNGVGRDVIEELEARRDDSRPVLVLVAGKTGGRWQPYGSLMAVTGPYLDGEIIAARIRSAEQAAALAGRYPEHQVLELLIEDGNPVFVEEQGFR